MKKSKNNGNIVILIIIYFICFIFISTAYSFFSETLEMHGTVGFSENVEKQYSYDYILQYSWEADGFYYYQYVVNITYTGNDVVDGWKLNVNMPSSTEIHDCYNASSCEVSNNILRVTNAYWNGYLTNNSIASPGFVIKTNIPNYELDVVSINFYKDGKIINSSNPESSEPDDENNNGGTNDETDVKIITDIVAEMEVSGYWDNSSQYKINLINNSTIDLIHWELKYQVPEGTKVSNVWGADYVIKDNELTLYDVSWNQIITSGSRAGDIGFQIETTTPAPATLKLISFKGVDSNYEDVEIKI